MSDTAFKLDTKGLDKLMKALKGAPTVKVGILGDGSTRQSGDGKLTNAGVGAIHELGKRSFLRVPIAEHIDQRLKDAGLFNKETLEGLLKSGSLKNVMQKVGIIAEGIVSDAFATGGFGKWPAWSNGYTNNTGMILVDSQQLRNSISSQVTEGQE